MLSGVLFLDEIDLSSLEASKIQYTGCENQLESGERGREKCQSEMSIQESWKPHVKTPLRDPWRGWSPSLP